MESRLTTKITILGLLLALLFLVLPAVAANENLYTVKDWSGSEGKDLIQETDLARLSYLNLVDAGGLSFDPAMSPAWHSRLKVWLLRADASSNMAYQLSGQLAAMDLNVNIRNVDGATSIYAPGTQSADQLGYATIQAVMAEADTELGLHPLTIAGSPEREYQEALKHALERANGGSAEAADLIVTGAASTIVAEEGELSYTAPGSIKACGDDVFGEADPPNDSDFTAIAAGSFHSLALHSSGTIEGFGWDEYGQIAVPAGTYKAMDAGFVHSIGLLSTGALAAWGDNENSQISPLPSGTFIAVGAGDAHSVALRSDGTIACWGDNEYGQVSGAPSGTFTAIAAGGSHNLALRSDGSLASWGYDAYNQVSATPSGNDFVRIAAGPYHSLALRSNGTIVAWGGDFTGQVSGKPSGTNFVAVSAGLEHSLALTSTGTVVGWGSDYAGQYPMPAGTYSAISAGDYYSLGIVGTSITPVAAFSANKTTGIAPMTVQFTDNSLGAGTLTYAWDFNNDGTPDSTAKNPVYTFPAAGTYTIKMRVTSSGGSYDEITKANYIKAQAILTIPGQANPPTDPDSDGLYEDMNGGGTIGFADVVIFFNNVEWIKANEPVSAFDFSGNGAIGFGDVVLFFNQVG
ncbi:MAG: PKD domain protein [Euryarchaeota archaeon ADurb.BinA087]|nr:MAG: PKD domain protein [Euryarchaeota archaeon ADurb.BinA087]